SDFSDVKSPLVISVVSTEITSDSVSFSVSLFELPHALNINIKIIMIASNTLLFISPTPSRSTLIISSNFILHTHYYFTSVNVYTIIAFKQLYLNSYKTLLKGLFPSEELNLFII